MPGQRDWNSPDARRFGASRAARAALDGGESFRVLAVCTANHCRSPLIEFALRRRSEELGLGWTLLSAGTRAETGRPAHINVQRLLDRRGDDYQGWRSRRVDEELLDSADLVLAASSDHRNEVVRLRPQVAPRTFLILPFGRYWASRVPAMGEPLDLPSRRQQVATARSHLPATEDGADLPDPMGRSRRVFRTVDHLIEAAADAIMRA